MKKYFLKNTHIAKYNINLNSTVYDFIHSDDFLVYEEEKYTKIRHIAITEDENGGYPFYVIPRYYIEYEL